MKITVAICTWNRADLLKITLENFRELKCNSEFSWELVVVNNNSTDNTDEVIDSFVDKLPVRKLSEPTPGLSHARNTAVENATGDYIVWTDDDVLVDENWLLAYARSFYEKPESVVFGGPVDPWFEGTPPSWLTDNWDLVSSAFAARDFGPSIIPLDPYDGTLPFGANFAVRILEQRQVLYNPKLGLRENKKILGEETAVMKEILTSGHSGWWIPDAKVKHFIPKQRQSLKYLAQYYIGQGKTRYLEDGISDDSTYLLGKPRWLYKKTLETQINYWLKRIFYGKSASIKEMAKACIYWGLFNEY